MQITIEIKCPTCLSDSIKKNGIKVDGKQNYQCKDCKRQFIGDHALSYLGCNSGITRKILQLMVRGSGIRDIAEVERISIGKVLRTLTESTYQIQPKQSHYESLEVDEFWTFVGNKNNKQWLIYAYHREKGDVRNQANGQEMEYMIVAESEANIREGKLAITTPIAKGLLGKKIGEIAELQVPSGLIKLEVLAISL